MTEETTNKTATETKQTAYYLSNDQYPCVLVGVIGEFDKGVPYPLIAEAPDPSLKSPKYDRALRKWVESDGQAQAQLIGQLQNQVGSLQDSDKELAQKNTDTNDTLKSMEKQNAQMLAMLSAALAPKPPVQPNSSNSASSTPSSAASTSESTAASESTKGSAE